MSRTLFLVDVDNLFGSWSKRVGRPPTLPGFTIDDPRGWLVPLAPDATSDRPPDPAQGVAIFGLNTIAAGGFRLRGGGALPGLSRAWLARFARQLDLGRPVAWETWLTPERPQAADRALLRALDEAALPEHAGQFKRVILLSADQGLAEAISRRLGDRPDAWHREPGGPRDPLKLHEWHLEHTRSWSPRGGIRQATPPALEPAAPAVPLDTTELASRALGHSVRSTCPGEIARLGTWLPTVLTQSGGAHSPRAVGRLTAGWATLREVGPEDGTFVGTATRGLRVPVSEPRLRSSPPGAVYFAGGQVLARTALPSWVIQTAADLGQPMHAYVGPKSCVLDDVALLDALPPGPPVHVTVSYAWGKLKASFADERDELSQWWVRYIAHRTFAAKGASIAEPQQAAFPPITLPVTFRRRASELVPWAAGGEVVVQRAIRSGFVGPAHDGTHTVPLVATNGSLQRGERVRAVPIQTRQPQNSRDFGSWVRWSRLPLLVVDSVSRTATPTPQGEVN